MSTQRNSQRMVRTCCSCGDEFSPTGKGYRCNSCRRQYDREWRKRRKKNGAPVISTKMPREWHRTYEAEYYADPTNRAARAANMRRYANDPALRHKHKARWATRRAIQSGAITKEPCEVCGGRCVEAHHDNYFEPLKVRWLCRAHHRDHHKAEGRS